MRLLRKAEQKINSTLDSPLFLSHNVFHFPPYHLFVDYPPKLQSTENFKPLCRLQLRFVLNPAELVRFVTLPPNPQHIMTICFPHATDAFCICCCMRSNFSFCA